MSHTAYEMAERRRFSAVEADHCRGGGVDFGSAFLLESRRHAGHDLVICRVPDKCVEVRPGVREQDVVHE